MRLHRWLPALLVLLAAAAPALPPGSRPVALTAQPGTSLDRAARGLLAVDLAEAGRFGEAPMLLVGSARLGTAAEGPALFVQLQSTRECGSAGCSTSVFLPVAGGWRKVLDGVSGDLAVAASRHRGMHDLASGRTRYVWSGRGYVDANPAPAMTLRARPPSPAVAPVH